MTDLARRRDGYNVVSYGAIDSRLASMRWFRCFAVPKKKKEDTTDGSDKNTADPNQSIRHRKSFQAACGQSEFQ